MWEAIDALRVLNAVLGVMLIILALWGPRRPSKGLDLARVAFAMWGAQTFYASLSNLGEHDWLRPLLTFLALGHSFAAILWVRRERKLLQNRLHRAADAPLHLPEVLHWPRVRSSRKGTHRAS